MQRFLATLGFLFFLLWATRGHFWTPLTAFFPQVHLLYGAAFLFLLWLLLFHRERFRSGMAVIVAWRHTIFPLAAFLVPLGIALIVPVRPQDGLFTAAAVVCFLFMRHGRPRPVTALLFVVPLVAGAGGYLYYQYLLTGEWLTYTQDLFFAITEENQFCHHIGLGTGCRRLTRFILPPEGLTMAHGFFVTMTRLSEMLFKATLHPLVWFFIFPALWRGARKHAAAFFLFIALVGGYYLFHQDGNFYGPRYYYSAIPPLLVVAAHGFVMLYDRMKGASRIALLAVPLSGVLFTGGIIMPSLAGGQNTEWYTANERMRALVAAYDIRESVLFVPFCFGHWYSFANPLTLQEVPPHDRRGNLYLNSIPLLDARTAASLVGSGYRAAWRITEEDDHFVIKPLERSREEEIVIEAEYKFKPVSGNALYGFLVSNFEDEKEFSFLGAATPLSGYFGYGIRFGEAGESVWWDAVHRLSRAGRYRITVTVVATPCGGETEFLVDGASLGTFPAGADSQRSVEFVAEVYLARGEHRFFLKPLEDDHCLVIDRITLLQHQSKVP